MKTLWPSIAMTLLWALPAPAMNTDPTTVATKSGLVQGSLQSDVVGWKGIPFSAPPVGALRWRAPQPAKSWRGVREALAYGSDCMQVPFPSDAAPLGTPPAEDCLHLNVWRPLHAKPPLPVIVWIYGGGFLNGGASPPTYAGANLARQGVVFVSFNYRLGRFGTFAHPALTRENADDGLLGNYGYLDQIAALRWVRENIAAFGGDPGNVTIVGESAGGISVHALVTSPLARGLFHRAVVMSGGDGAAGVPASLADVESIGLQFAQSKGIARDASQALAKLRALPAEAVTDGLNLMQLIQPATGPRTFAIPYVDGRIAIDALAAYASGDFQHVPMMIGATDDDVGGPQGPMVTGARDIAGVIASHDVPVYAYLFSYVADSVGKPGAQHATDVPYFFDNVAIKYGDAATARDASVGHRISAYLVAFAKGGRPAVQGLPEWPRHDGGPQAAVMDLGASASLQPAPRP